MYLIKLNSILKLSNNCAYFSSSDILGCTCDAFSLSSSSWRSFCDLAEACLALIAAAFLAFNTLS